MPSTSNHKEVFSMSEKPNTVVVIQFRLPSELHSELKEEAHQERTSMNKMMAEILRERYKRGE